MLTIVDYGMGNLRSVQKACERVSAPARISGDPHEIATADKLILPGVGAFRDAMAQLQQQGLIEPIKAHIAAEKPFLGICLGLQLLFEVSHEDGEWPGLGILPGKVVRFPADPELKVPHMGWNVVEPVGAQPLLEGVPAGSYFYFVHSYYVQASQPELVGGWTDYGRQFASMIARGNLFATQFHPEKSQTVGRRVLENFAKL